MILELQCPCCAGIYQIVKRDTHTHTNTKCNIWCSQQIPAHNLPYLGYIDLFMYVRWSLLRAQQFIFKAFPPINRSNWNRKHLFGIEYATLDYIRINEKRFVLSLRSILCLFTVFSRLYSIFILFFLFFHWINGGKWAISVRYYCNWYR